MKHKTINHRIDSLYTELYEEDTKYGAAGKKIKKARTDVQQKRAVTNLRKAWEQHEDDFEECDEFYSD